MCVCVCGGGGGGEERGEEVGRKKVVERGRNGVGLKWPLGAWMWQLEL